MQLPQTGEDTEDNSIAAGTHEGKASLPLAPMRARAGRASWRVAFVLAQLTAALLQKSSMLDRGSTIRS